MTRDKKVPSEHAIRVIAAAADVDPRTARRALVDGKKPRARVDQERIIRACLDNDMGAIGTRLLREWNSNGHA